MTDAAPQARLKFGGAPIRTLWAWIVTDPDGKEAIARSPWSETAPLISPDLENVSTTAIGEWVRSYYEPQGIAFRLVQFDTTEPAPGPPFVGGDHDPALLEAAADSVVAGIPPGSAP